MIGQSIINIKSGGRGRLSGITAALALLAFILFASTYIEMIPIAALSWSYVYGCDWYFRLEYISRL